MQAASEEDSLSGGREEWHLVNASKLTIIDLIIPDAHVILPIIRISAKGRGGPNDRNTESLRTTTRNFRSHKRAKQASVRLLNDAGAAEAKCSLLARNSTISERTKNKPPGFVRLQCRLGVVCRLPLCYGCFTLSAILTRTEAETQRSK